MPLPIPILMVEKNDGIKRRKSHKKSRTGCRNCRLRSVKCDENKPDCKTCKSYGVCCNFDSKVPDLQLALGGTAIKTIENTASRLPIIKVTTSLYLSNEELDRLWRFQKRTAFSLGTVQGSHSMQRLSIEFAFTHPYVMHIIQAMTSVHDRYLSNSSPRQTQAESYHLSQAAALLQRKLSGSIEAPDKDPIWATAAMLGSTTASMIEASTPEEAWPLATQSEADLDWLRMSKMKMAVWEVANPMRADSVFHDQIFKTSPPPDVTTPVLDNTPLKFVQLFELGNLSTLPNNPYYTAVQTIVSILFVPYSRADSINIFGFLRYMQPTFELLLEQKDPRSLLLMAYWYSKLREGMWWIERRATLECQAICIYLERYHAEETLLQELLQFPKIICGLGSSPRSSSLSNGNSARV